MLLEMKNLCKTYGETIALDRLNLQLTPGIYGLLGPNGAGKSTLMKLICMLIQPTDGIVLFDGEDIRMHRNNFLDRLGYMPQHSCLYPDFTVQEYLYYVGSLKGMHKKDVTFRTEELLLRTRLMDMKKDKIQTLSGGMQQRLMFAQALLNDPEILILDEPTAGLDPQKRLELRNLIAEYSKDKIILLATHIVSDIELIASQIL
ncbi:MAG: ATP-binding cassette domain-containing protein, partial [Ruminococcus sp.]|nr:ATP-binding cassette domain-containing protein [Ruminococcus sp.]